MSYFFTKEFREDARIKTVGALLGIMIAVVWKVRPEVLAVSWSFAIDAFQVAGKVITDLIVGLAPVWIIAAILWMLETLRLLTQIRRDLAKVIASEPFNRDVTSTSRDESGQACNGQD